MDPSGSYYINLAQHSTQDDAAISFYLGSTRFRVDAEEEEEKLETNTQLTFANHLLGIYLQLV
jgi:hypothetical protein